MKLPILARSYLGAKASHSCDLLSLTLRRLDDQHKGQEKQGKEEENLSYKLL